MKVVVILVLAIFQIVYADQKSFDCKMRQLAMDFARKIQPFRSQQQFQELADALNGAPEAQKCTVTVPKGSPFKSPAFPIPSAGVTVYVDAVHGQDSQSGTKESPFKTIPRALQATRSAGTPSVIILRQGTFYLSSTITLTPQDNGLTIQNYPGEEVWVSGAVPLNVKWTPYKIGNNTWSVFDNQNNVWGQAQDHADTPTIKYLGEFETVDQCQAACVAFNRDGLTCQSYTFHTPQIGTSWAKQCFAVVDFRWTPVAEANIDSGRRNNFNIYVADLSAYKFSSVPGLRIDGVRAIRARYPNANPEFGFGSDLQATSWLPSVLPKEPEIEVNPNTPVRSSSNSFQRYQLGIGGPCKNFVPPAGYWCGNRTEGGGAFTYLIPTGLVQVNPYYLILPIKTPLVELYRHGVQPIGLHGCLRLVVIIPLPLPLFFPKVDFKELEEAMREIIFTSKMSLKSSIVRMNGFLIKPPIYYTFGITVLAALLLPPFLRSLN